VPCSGLLAGRGLPGEDDIFAAAAAGPNEGSVPSPEVERVDLDGRTHVADCVEKCAAIASDSEALPRGEAEMCSSCVMELPLG